MRNHSSILSSTSGGYLYEKNGKKHTFLGEDKKIYDIFKGANLVFMSTK